MNHFETNQGKMPPAEKRKEDLIRPEIDEFKEIVAQYFDAESAAKIHSALNLMIEAHSKQKDRSNGRPFMTHPLETARDVIEKYEIRDPELVVAALLHDAVEDQSLKFLGKRLEREYGEYGPIWKEIKIENREYVQTKYQAELTEIALREIGFLYGERVKKIVGKLTNPDFGALIEELKLKGVEKTKNELYKEHVEEAIQDTDAFVVKYADFVQNALVPEIIPDKLKVENQKKRYGPVIQEVFLPAFRTMAENHPLYPKREAIIAELEKAYQEKYLVI